MFAKNNYKERLRKMEQKTERFSIRKLSIGAASVLIGLSFLGFNSHTAHAASDENADKNVSTTDSDVASVQDQVNDKGTINTVNASELDKSTDSKQVGEVSSTLDTAQSAKTDSINTAASKEKRTTETQPEAKSTVSTETSTVSRTIKYINPLTNKEVTLADQKAEFKRTVTKYPDSGKTVYGAWEPASAVFSAVKVPEFEGYQASFSSNEVAEEVVTPGANRQITSWILYNKISETHDTNTTIPANPPKISTEISTVSRTLKYVDPITNVEHTLSDQKAEFKRTVTKYPDSGKTVYGAWEPASAVFSAVKVPEFEGYHASFSPSDVAEVVVTPSTDLNLTSWIIYYKNSGGIQYATLADNKVIVTPKGTPVNPIDGIGNVPELKPGTTYSWTNGVPDVNTIGSSTVEITVNQPGLNPQVVTTTIIVTGTEKPGDPGITNPDDSKYSDLFKTVERYIIFDEPVNYYTQTQKAIFGRSKTVAAVNGKAVVTYGNYGVYDPETQTLNSQTEKTLPAVSVKQFDGYTSLVNDEQATVIPSLNVNVDSPNSQIAVTYKKDSSPSTYIPQGKDIITPYGKMPKPEEGIANIPELPAGTKYTWKDNGPDVYTPGTQVAIVTVTYPDGNTDDVPVMVTVEDPIPEGKDITTPNGKVPEAETAIGNVPEMPEGTKYEWQTTPEVKTPGKKPAVVVVTFP
ncbi:Rib/alpha-like domain-containing protein, partial [Lactobacillus rodentium]